MYLISLGGVLGGVLKVQVLRYWGGCPPPLHKLVAVEALAETGSHQTDLQHPYPWMSYKISQESVYVLPTHLILYWYLVHKLNALHLRTVIASRDWLKGYERLDLDLGLALRILGQSP